MNDAGKIMDIEDQLLEFWGRFSAKPKMMGMSLGNVRNIRWSDPEVNAWLEANKDLPDDCLVVLGLGTVIIYSPQQADDLMKILKWTASGEAISSNADSQEN